jgi:HK97 family phage prohead protease
MPSLDELKDGATQYRSAVIESVDRDKSELFVKAAPYNVRADIGGGIDEEFRTGTFARAAKSPERLLVWHDHRGPMTGRGVAVEDKPDGVWVRARLASTTAAKDMVSLIDDKFLTDVSIEFNPMPEWMDVQQRGNRLEITHRRAHLLGFAVVPEGAYGSAAFVASLRDLEREREAEKARLWLEAYRRKAI